MEDIASVSSRLSLGNRARTYLLSDLRRAPPHPIALSVTGSLPAPAQRPAQLPQVDPLTAALERGVLEPVIATVSEREALIEASGLLEEANRGDYTSWLRARAIDLAVQYPNNERLQYRVAKLTELSGDQDATRLCWRGIAERFPNSYNIFPEYFRTILKTCGVSVASTILESYEQAGGPRADPERAILIARCREISGDHDAALKILDGIETGGPDADQVTIEKARLLHMSGRFDEALSCLAAGNAATADPALVSDIERAATSFRGHHTHGPPSVAALDILLAQALENRAAKPPVRADHLLGGIILVGASLGGGGAERQLANTALGLSQRSDSGNRVHGLVSIFCRKLDRRRGNDFYLSRLERANIRVADYLSAQRWGGSQTVSTAGVSPDIVALLPERMREGVIRLTDIFRYEAPDVVQIWQDGMIFASGLAALMANIPRIVLNVRTMPPNHRTDRGKPEQKTLYRGLLSAEGISLTANARVAARAYEHWLDLPRNSVLTVANGVDPLSTDTTEAERSVWRRFDTETGTEGFVLGGVMRFDDNKRPLLWLEICAALASYVPKARFVIAGHGPLRSAAEEFARSAGIAQRTLFVGRTSHVGFWLDKMDALALTSRHEGVPNALIEAQLAGLPVVTTPAGGAPEAVAPHAANHILADAELPDAESAARHLANLATVDEKGWSEIRDHLRHWAADQFAMDHMVDRTIDIFSMR